MVVSKFIQKVQIEAFQHINNSRNKTKVHAVIWWVNNLQFFEDKNF